MQPVRCANCGYLAVRNLESRELCEADIHMRADGRFPKTPPLEGNSLMAIASRHDRKYTHDLRPICFRMQPSMAQHINGEESPAAFLRVIQEERQCDVFVKWMQGFSPKEHAQMEILGRQELREARRDRFNLWQLVILGVLVPIAMIVTQFITTRMQVAAAIEQGRAAFKQAK